jgi:Tat protein secretion system quality control protein TatD with DNase activity
VARQIAELRGLAVEQVGELTSRNFEALFGVPRS